MNKIKLAILIILGFAIWIINIKLVVTFIDYFANRGWEYTKNWLLNDCWGYYIAVFTMIGLYWVIRLNSRRDKDDDMYIR